MGWKLLDVQPLWVLPPLAVEVGLNEAIVLQHLYYRAQGPNVQIHDDRRWVQATVETLQLEFPFWSTSTVERTVKSLKDGGYVESRRSRDGNLYTVDTSRTRQIDGSDPSTWPVSTRQSDGTPCKGEEKTEQEELFAGEPAVESPEDQVVSEVWTHYLNLFEGKLRIKELTPPRRRMILKAWKAVGESTTFLIGAISGLKFYRDGHPDGSQDTSLSVIFETGPHSGRSLTDQIEWWSSLAPSGSDASVVVIPTHLKHVASQHQITVARFMNRTREIPDSLEEESKVSAAWLRDELGIEAKRRDDGTIQWVKTSADA